MYGHGKTGHCRCSFGKQNQKISFLSWLAGSCLSGGAPATFGLFISLWLTGLTYRQKKTGLRKIFDLAGGLTISGTWLSHAPLGFCSNAEFGAKLFMFFVQTQSRKQNFLCFWFKRSAGSKT